MVSMRTQELAGNLWRIIVIAHRYAGIAIGLLMVMWFVSGIVSQVPNERGIAMTPSSRRKAPISSMRARRRSFS